MSGAPLVALHIDDHQYGCPRIELEHIWPYLDNWHCYFPHSIFEVSAALQSADSPSEPEPEARGLRLSSCLSTGPNPRERQRATRRVPHLLVG